MSHEFDAQHPRDAKLGRFTATTQSPAETTLDLTHEETLHDSGITATVTVTNSAGDIIEVRKYDDAVDGDGNPVISSHQFFTGREHHDPDHHTPAVRTWEEGAPALVIHYRHGEMQDPEDGGPALTFLKDGRETLHIHYSAGKMQDPEPGTPAHVATLDDGAQRQTFLTQGVATKQIDKMPLPGLSDLIPGAGLTVTRTATRTD